MIKIIEKKGYFGTAYEKFLDEYLIREINIVRCVKTVDRFKYMFLVNSDGEVIDEVYKYLNESIGQKNPSTRNQAISALKILYSFSELFCLSLNDINRDQVSLLSNFVSGGIYHGENQLYLYTIRTDDTHDIYMSIYRDFFLKNNIQCDSLFSKSVVRVERDGFGEYAHTKIVNVEKFDINKATSRRKKVPKHIKLSEYYKIIETTCNGSSILSLRNQIIVKLMYLRGMRIGEICGTTIEDIQHDPENPGAGQLYIRNRLSDKRHQRAKGVMKVNKESDYDTDKYKTEDVGFQVVSLQPEIMELIQRYIEQSRDIESINERLCNNLLNYAKADSVVHKNIDNYYLFLSKNYRPISETGWNDIMKSIYKHIGIVIDKGKKTENLNHRLRHGYGMLLKDLGFSLVDAQEELRHNSPFSTTIYFRNTDERKLMIGKRVQQKVTEMAGINLRKTFTGKDNSNTGKENEKSF